MKHIRRFNDTNELKTALANDEYIEPWLSYCNNDNQNNTLYRYNYKCDYDNMFIDLGLPSGTLWGAYNLGANNIYQLGNIYAWGEIIPKTESSWDNYKFGTQTNLTKYNDSDSLTVLQDSDDIVNLTLGGDARIPTLTQTLELIDNTSGDYTKLNSENFIVLTSNINGKSIYFKLYKSTATNRLYGTWTSTLSSSNKQAANGFTMHSESGFWSRETTTFYRWALFPIRPVVALVK